MKPEKDIGHLVQISEVFLGYQVSVVLEMGAHRSEGRSRDWLQQDATEQQVQSMVSGSVTSNFTSIHGGCISLVLHTLLAT